MNKKKIIRIVILIVIIIILILICRVIYINGMKLKFKKILEKNDSTNYELVENYNGEETTVKVRGKTLVSDNNDTYIWISQLDKKRVIISKDDKIAVLTENDQELVVNSLNYTYLQSYFENSDEKFKYLGKENNFYKIKFTNKRTEIINYLYINIDSGIIEKKVEEKNGIQIMTELNIKLNSVSESEIEYPNLTEYEVVNSVSSVIQ